MADFPLQFLLTVKNEMGSGISQATSQIKGLGDQAQQTQTKAKSSGMGIGAAFQFTALNAFNLAHSLIETKRSYEDLDKAENQQKVRLEAIDKASRRVQNAEITLFKARQKGDPARIVKAENMLATARVNLDQKTRAAKLGQIDLNRAHEDFYLNIIPNVISGLGTVFGLFQVMQGAGGIGGLISSFKKLALPIAIISGLFFAIKTNFLGFRDFLTGLGNDIGNAIPALKPFLNILQEVGELLGLLPAKKGTKAGGGLNKAIADLKAQFGPIIDFFKNIIDDVMKGDWSKVFQRISAAAAVAWAQLKKAFPLLGDIESLVNKIQNGNWKGALLQIWKAAVDTWEAIKKAVPFLGDIEAFIRAIAAGKWDVAFAAIKKAIVDSGVGAAIQAMFGADTPGKVGVVTKFITEVQQIPEKVKAALNAPGGGDPFGGTSIIDQIIGLKNWSVNGFIEAFKGKLTEGFKLDTWWGDDPNPPGKQMLDSFFASANTWIKTNVDAFVASLLDPKTWMTAIETQIATMEAGVGNIGKLIMDALFGKKDAKTGKNTQMENNAQAIGQAIVEGIGNWFRDVMPKSKAALDAGVAFWNSIGTALTIDTKSIIYNATTAANAFIKGVSDAFTIENVGKIIHALVNAIRNALNQVKQDFINIGDRIGKFISQGIKSAVLAVLNAMPFFPGSNLDQLRKQVQGAGRAAGFHGFTTGPTLVGERATERVDVTPMSDFINRRGSDSGTGKITVIVPVMLDRKQIAEVVASEISVNQAVYR